MVQPAHPIRRNYSAVRAYSDRLRDLMSRLAADPLNEAKSLDVVAHIVDGRGDAAELLDDLESHTLGVPC